MPRTAPTAKSKEVGTRLRALRKATGAKQAETAAAIGIERTTLTGIETGAAMPGRETMAALAKHFGVSIDYLERGAPPPGQQHARHKRLPHLRRPAGRGCRPGQQPLPMILVLAWLIAGPAIAAPSAAEMCRVIQQDIAAYLATGSPCACPYSAMRNGAMCGNRSAWAKPAGRAPRCYFGDVDGSTPPNRRPNPTRQSWPDPPPCSPAS